jgi:hypothetical protein
MKLGVYVTVAAAFAAGYFWRDETNELFEADVRAGVERIVTLLETATTREEEE